MYVENYKYMLIFWMPQFNNDKLTKTDMERSCTMCVLRRLRFYDRPDVIPN